MTAERVRIGDGGAVPAVGLVVGREGAEGVQIRIEHVGGDDRIRATVVHVGEFWGARRLAGHHGTDLGFVFGEELTLEPDGMHGRRWWRVARPKRRPWHSLEVLSDGRVTFEPH